MITTLKDLPWYLKRKRRKANIRSGGHSQYGQDVTVFELLGKPATGVFLDIGANDGVSLSNSLFFEEQGWIGICVEPHPTIFKQLQQNRKCHLINACISNKDAMVQFLMVEGGANMLSGIVEFCDEHHLKRIDADIQQFGGQKKIINIESLTPTELLSRFKIRSVDFLSIDVEGADFSILQTFDFQTTHVKLISIENNRSSSIYHYLKSKGFNLAKCVGCDEIYINSSVQR